MKNIFLIFVNTIKCMLIVLIAATFLLACGNVDDKNVTPADELDFFEEEIVGKWTRYHAYDDSYDYIILNADRTGCKFETHDGTVKNKSSYGYWKLEAKPGSTTVYDIYKGSNKNNLSKIDVYHYDTDLIWMGGYSNLKMSRSSTSRTCD